MAMTPKNIVDEIAGDEPELEDDTGQDAGDEEELLTLEEEDEGEGEQKSQQQQEAERQQMVPQGALHEERAKRQTLARELETTRAQVQRMEQLWQQMLMQQQGGPQRQQQPQQQIPPMEEDPAGHLAARMDQMQRQLAAWQQGEQQKTVQQQQQEAAAARERQFLNNYAQSAQSFAEKQPDFHQAYNFLAEAVDKELQARGFADPVERKRIAEFEEGRMVGRWMSLGDDPAEQVYQLAKHYGWDASRAAQGGRRGAQGQRGQQEQQGEQQPLERLQSGQRAAQSLNGAGRTAGGVSLQQLASMDPDDPNFDKLWEQARRKGMLG